MQANLSGYYLMGAEKNHNSQRSNDLEMIKEKMRERNNMMIRKLVERMSKQVSKIAIDKFQKYKFELVSILTYLQDISLQINAEFQTYWIASLYLRQAIAKGAIDPEKINDIILGSMICLSCAVKFDECGRQMKLKSQIDPNNKLPDHRDSKHAALYDVMKLTIINEQTSSLIDPVA